jgi:formate hydrogenlyase subunit 6/NADH:ubiquinone oxidoreductase subunit I
MISHGATRCRVCEARLRGWQRKFCSKKCAVSWISVGDYQKQRRTARKRRLVALLGGRCQRCGFSEHTCALSFHHRDPATKRFPLETNQLSRRPWGELVLEAKKCTLLCLNCHAILHWA